MSRISLSDFTLAVAPTCVENQNKYRAYFLPHPVHHKCQKLTEDSVDDRKYREIFKNIKNVKNIGNL